MRENYEYLFNTGRCSVSISQLEQLTFVGLYVFTQEL